MDPEMEYLIKSSKLAEKEAKALYMSLASVTKEITELKGNLEERKGITEKKLSKEIAKELDSILDKIRRAMREYIAYLDEQEALDKESLKDVVNIVNEIITSTGSAPLDTSFEEKKDSFICEQEWPEDGSKSFFYSFPYSHTADSVADWLYKLNGTGRINPGFIAFADEPHSGDEEGKMEALMAPFTKDEIIAKLSLPEISYITFACIVSGQQVFLGLGLKNWEIEVETASSVNLSHEVISEQLLL